MSFFGDQHLEGKRHYKTLTKNPQEMLTSNGMRNPSLLYWGASCVVENVKAFDQNVSWLLRDSTDVNVFY